MQTKIREIVLFPSIVIKVDSSLLPEIQNDAALSAECIKQLHIRWSVNRIGNYDVPAQVERSHQRGWGRC
jgi:hypothetical protein